MENSGPKSVAQRLLCQPLSQVLSLQGPLTSTESTFNVTCFDQSSPTIFRFEGHPNRKALADSAACGKVPSAQNRIVGGQAADIGQYPWLANLGYALASEPNNVQFKCGGALVGDRYVITAAHCVTNLPGGFEL